MGWQLEETITVSERGFDQLRRAIVRHAGYRGGLASVDRALGRVQLMSVHGA